MTPRWRTIAVAALALLLIPLYSNPASSVGEAREPSIGWHVPWAVGGPRLAHDGSLYQHPGEWPAFDVEAIRLWDTRTAWLNLQPRPDLFDFSHLDAHLERAEAAGVDHITLVLAGTPRWAATREMPSDAPWLGPGSAAPPTDVEDWRGFVTAVTERYRGRIHAYEIGNEPNLPQFWSGDYQQLATLVHEAADIIRAQDPQARILAPAPLITELRDVVHARELWANLIPGSVDTLSFHYYPRSPRSIEYLPAIVRHLKRAAQQHGFSGAQLWITEANPGASATAADIAAMERTAGRAGINRWYWYAWMQRESWDLLEFHSP